MYNHYEKWRPSTQTGSMFDAVDDYRYSRAKAIALASAEAWDEGLAEFEAAVAALGCHGFCPELAADQGPLYSGYRRPMMLPPGWGEFTPSREAAASAPVFIRMLDEQERAAKEAARNARKAAKEAAYAEAHNPFAALAALRSNP